MTAYLDNLLLARDQIASNLVAITANPKPNYSIDGQSVSWQDLFDSYMQQLAQLDLRIAASTPFEIHTQAHT